MHGLSAYRYSISRVLLWQAAISSSLHPVFPGERLTDSALLIMDTRGLHRLLSCSPCRLVHYSTPVSGTYFYGYLERGYGSPVGDICMALHEKLSAASPVLGWLKLLEIVCRMADGNLALRCVGTSTGSAELHLGRRLRPGYRILRVASPLHNAIGAFQALLLASGSQPGVCVCT